MICIHQSLDTFLCQFLAEAALHDACQFIIAGPTFSSSSKSWILSSRKSRLLSPVVLLVVSFWTSSWIKVLISSKHPLRHPHVRYQLRQLRSCCFRTETSSSDSDSSYPRFLFLCWLVSRGMAWLCLCLTHSVKPRSDWLTLSRSCMLALSQELWHVIAHVCNGSHHQRHHSITIAARRRRGVSSRRLGSRLMLGAAILARVWNQSLARDRWEGSFSRFCWLAN